MRAILKEKKKKKELKFALVTGANSEVGMLICLELMESGFAVIATMKNFIKKTELVNKANELGLSHLLNVLPMDVANSDDVSRVKTTVEKAYGKIHLLVNHADFCRAGAFADLSYKDWEEQFQTNVHGTVRVIQAFLPLLENATSPRIINISGISGYFGFPEMSAYCASKYAMEGMSESLRLELLPKNIFVSVVQPSSYLAKITEKRFDSVSDEEQNSSFKSKMQARMKKAIEASIDPLDVAELIAEISEAQRPKFRYRIGSGATSLYWIKSIFPWFITEKVMIYTLKEKTYPSFLSIFKRFLVNKRTIWFK